MPSDDQIIGPGGFGAFLVSIGGGTLHGAPEGGGNASDGVGK